MLSAYAQNSAATRNGTTPGSASGKSETGSKQPEDKKKPPRTTTTTTTTTTRNSTTTTVSASTTTTTVTRSTTTTTSTTTSTTLVSSDVCTTGQYPAQWTWAPTGILAQPAAATSGTPKINQIRNGVVIATYSSLGGDAGYSKPNSMDTADTAVGPFRRQPYTQWRSGDIFEVYPAVYSGATMQIYIGPNVANDTAYNNGVRDVPANITIRGVTVDGKRPVIVNPSTGASNSNYGQSLIYIDALYKDNVRVTASSNITIENIDVVDASTGGGLGKAAIYVNGAHNLTLRNMRISGFKRHSANGIFATGNNSGTLLLENVELDSNGGAGGPEHNAYINGSATDPNFTFKVVGSWSHDSYYGHELKSRAQNTVIEGSYLSGQRATSTTQTEAYLLDVPDGGTLTARNNIFVKGYSGNSSNGASLTFGVESQNPARTWGLTVEHNTFVALSRYYDDQGHRLYPMFISANAPGPRFVDANIFVGYCPSGSAALDFRGTNYSILNFADIDMSYHPLRPIQTFNSRILGTPQYGHVARTESRKTTNIGARD